VTRALVAALAGAIFGVGLLLSGMTDPAKVLGFLDFTGAWDPSLAFVMMGAIGVHALAYQVIRRRERPLLDAGFHVPLRCDLDGKLFVGAAIFGVGWGLGGFCPGPALVAAASGATSALVFAAAMVVGMLAQHAAAPKLGV
jgi:uncharacterized membrane protein YedE/YeeE